MVKDAPVILIGVGRRRVGREDGVLDLIDQALRSTVALGGQGNLLLFSREVYAPQVMLWSVLTSRLPWSTCNPNGAVSH
jgi:hypothetical protein